MVSNNAEELKNKLKEELRHWTNNLPHYSNMQLILEQYAEPYLQRTNIIKNIENNAETIKPEIITFLLHENNALDLLLKIKYCNLNDLYKKYSSLKYHK